jgi:hypothetical protein
MGYHIFKVEAEGDVMFIKAGDLADAKRKLLAVMGPIPESMLTWTEVEALPAGEEFMAEPAPGATEEG